MNTTLLRMAMGGICVLVMAGAQLANAQVITTPYWCGSYWSSQPCSYGSMYNNYGYTYSYPSSYYYPYNNYYSSYYGPYGYQYPAPTCSLTYSYATYSHGYYPYSYYGGSNQAITLSWTSANATSAYISAGVGAVSPFGLRVVYPNYTTTYLMTVYGPGGTNTCQVTYYAPYYQYYYQYPSYGYPYYSY
jgi:hypothetical protein